MLHLYIDTNAYLTFYHLTSDDLEELKKLLALISGNEITLYLPEQTQDEFFRNREIKIADALKRFKEEKLNNQFPQICKDYPEYEKIKNAITDFEKNKSLLLEQLIKDIFDKNLLADKILNNLFDVAKTIPIEKRIVDNAKFRFDVGRPPGKNKSYGDAINWESLLTYCPDKEDLHFISDDKDFYSEIDSNNFNDYLLDEWKTQKNSNLFHYRRISEFFKQNFATIKIASDYEKDLLLKNLSSSSTFARSRIILQKLNKYDDFSSDQINEFGRICIDNTQVNWISGDTDIKSYLTNILTKNKEKLENDLKEELKEEFDYLEL